mgnify:CR=1 FL=1|jgi:uncharacterized protein YcgI (DUF1989 family)
MKETDRAADQFRVEHGNAIRLDLDPGDLVTISTSDGAQGGDFSFPGFDQSLTRNKIGWQKFGRPWLVYSADPGDSLYDGDGEAVFEVVEYRADGSNDIMYPGCWDEVYPDRRPGCRDLISAALAIERRQITGMLSFFISHTADDQAYRGLGEVDLNPGDYLSLRALRATAAAVSACPDTEIPGWRAGDLCVEVTPGQVQV